MGEVRYPTLELFAQNRTREVDPALGLGLAFGLGLGLGLTLAFGLTLPLTLPPTLTLSLALVSRRGERERVCFFGGNRIMNLSFVVNKKKKKHERKKLVRSVGSGWQ